MAADLLRFMRNEERSPAADARLLVEETLRLGLMLTDTVGQLLDDLPEDAFPGENPAVVLLEMVAGSVTPAVEVAGPEVVAGAVALMGAVGDRVIADLKRAMELAAERE